MESEKKYKDMIKNILIKDILLKNLNLKDVKIPENDNQFSVSLHYECKDVNYIGKDLIEFNPIFKLSISTEEEETVNLQFEFSVIYFIKDIDEYKENYINDFKKINLPVNIWPYARELISSITTRIGYPSLLIEPYTVGV